MNKKLLIVIAAIAILLVLLFSFKKTESEEGRVAWWKFQSIDTMKYSRDVSREKLNDTSFDETISEQTKQIASTGATHVAIATPYDEEFYPILKRWVEAARRNNLKVWFRGNWSGWEGWFEYPKITREEHIKKTEDFIKKHKDIFEDGDVFTACPECENGGPGDPRRSGDVEGHRVFLIEEYRVTKRAFREINKDVASNFNSMNGDVARVVMDRQTTKAMDGIVTIDHYVATPQKLINDIGEISRSSGGKVVLGEFGAPIPDIHGNMNEEDQASWIREAMYELIRSSEVAGLNYWTNVGSSTALWQEDGKEKEAASALRSFYKATVVRILVKDEAGSSVKDVKISLNGKEYSPDSKGDIHLPYFENLKEIELTADGYFSKNTMLTDSENLTIVVVKKNPDLVYKVLRVLKNLF